MLTSTRRALLLVLLVGAAVPGLVPGLGSDSGIAPVPGLVPVLGPAPVPGLAPVLGPAPVPGPAPAAERLGNGDRWAPPLGRPLVLAAPFRAPPHPYGSGHRGIDLPARAGAVIAAPATGSVSFSGTVADRGVISIRVDGRTVLSMEPVETELSAGDVVVRGQPVGEVSAGGHCGDECLHLGVRVDGEYVNPMRYFLRRPMLLPW
ncbi:M23 family metallopeptidase [Leucobacter sp. CSA1]|uniref:M23 family metallopeptidase n=1 Tax=Leucobacter chromiisoli TaxID=2796471 RepID=A0A934QBR0_9MICO|nr:M23 family metallopeptidase [Leucobacter chromiisoli]MBK0420372.1 M23 family metallopeptidase [Leucobacter chromiisoli]